MAYEYDFLHPTRSGRVTPAPAAAPPAPPVGGLARLLPGSARSPSRERRCRDSPSPASERRGRPQQRCRVCVPGREPRRRVVVVVRPQRSRSKSRREPGGADRRRCPGRAHRPSPTPSLAVPLAADLGVPSRDAGRGPLDQWLLVRVREGGVCRPDRSRSEPSAAISCSATRHLRPARAARWPHRRLIATGWWPGHGRRRR